MKDIKELRTLTPQQLMEELLTLRRKQLGLRIQKTNGTLEKTHLVKQIRKTIARIKTIISEKVGKSHGK